MADLERYRAKRNAAVTPEPFSGGAGPSGEPIFVVQRHDARRLHYDFRLERGGALASWAVPKGVPLKVGERALAVHVEDHPLEYATFSGRIPAGQYGAGSVEIWDHGTYELVEEKKDGQLTVRLSGRRLDGTWTLVPAHLDGKEQNWLLIRRSDGDERRRVAPIAEIVRKGKRSLKLSNLDKPFWPEEGLTKGDLLAYYQAVAPAILPHLKGRPFTMRRHPDGVDGKMFFQKDAPSHMPEWIATFRTEVSTRQRPPVRKWIDVPVVNDELSLLWMANMGCIEMNTWYSRVDKPDRPDFVLFDLDPTPATPWQHTIEVARLLKQLFDRLELESFVKTSGGKGMHILVPVTRRSTYAETRAFSEVVADTIVRVAPNLATREWAKARREGVLIDANQNGEGKTIASAYSVRARHGATVSTPLSWDEVDETLDPSVFTMPEVLGRVSRLGDIHAPMLKTSQSLAAVMRSLR